MVITIGEVLSQWQNYGVFDYVLPFLLIFAIVFGILRSTNILGKDKGVHVIIALVVGALAIWSGKGYVQRFFSEMFPQLGVGLAVILALVILVGLFVNGKEAKMWGWIFAAVGAIVWIVILVGSSENAGWWSGGAIEDYAGLIIGAVLLIGVIIAVSASKSEGKSDMTHERHKWEAD
ncbi:MAG: hypothetical protein MUF61_03080 [archaeon]|jgi:hypothetical protein|nr:hypothetical protein [archaeon]